MFCVYSELCFPNKFTNITKIENVFYTKVTGISKKSLNCFFSFLFRAGRELDPNLRAFGWSMYGEDDIDHNEYPGKYKIYEGCSLISAFGFLTRKSALPSESEH